jgi:transcriptional regulator with XRE-family HTH domain
MLICMDAVGDIAEFLTSRRARVTPDQVGLPSYGPRRVKGLRREEVASLAGVSVEYYKRLERGQASGVSDGVLEALASALRLDDAERAHLFDLARAVSPLAPRRQRPRPQRLRPAIERMLDAIDAPALAYNGCHDYLGANRLFRALYAPVFESHEQPPNGLRFTFLDPAAREFYVDWERVARDLVASLRSEAGRNPRDQSISHLVGELATRSPEFAGWWAAHNVRYHRTGTKHLRHPLVGELELEYEALNVAADDGVTISVFSAEPGSRSGEQLALLASWAATPDPAPPSAAITITD